MSIKSISKTYMLISFVFLYQVSIQSSATTIFDEQRSEGISDTKWDALKATVYEQKITSKDGYQSRVGVSVDLDPLLDRAVIGANASEDNGYYSGSAYVFEFENNVWVEKAKLVADDAEALSSFGHSVAIDGDLIAVGAPGLFPNNPSAVYVFKKNGLQWQQQQKIIPSDLSLNSRFGWSISVVNQRLLIGDYYGRNNAAVSQQTGAAYIVDYDANTSQWMTPVKLLANDGLTSDFFGFSVDLSADGTRAIIGAKNTDDNGNNSGSVYVFELVAGAWQQTTKLLGSATGVSSGFGRAVAISNDVMSVAGTTSHDEDVYVFELLNNQWQETAILNDNISDSLFGSTIEVSAQTIAIMSLSSSSFSPKKLHIYRKSGQNWTDVQTFLGTPGFGAFGLDIHEDRMLVSNLGSGSNYYEYIDSPLCTNSGNCWEEQANLINFDTTEGDGFGVAIDVSGNRAVIGAYQDDDKGANAGAAYIFEYTGISGTTVPVMWRQVKKLTASDGAAGDAFGRSVAIDGDRVIVGAYLNDFQNSSDTGAVYVYDFDDLYWNETEKLLADNGFPIGSNDLFGFSIDLDGNRIVVGAHKDDENGLDSGAVYVFDLANMGWEMTEKIMPVNAQAGDAFGYALSLDGEKILIGAFLDDEVAINAGAAYVYKHEVNQLFDFWIEQDKLLPINGSANDYFGTAVSLDNSQALVGAYFSDNASFPLILDTGMAYFFQQDGSSWILINKVIASDAAFNDRFAYSVSLQDNRALIGSWFDDDLGEDSGTVYLFELDSNTSLWTELEKITAEDGESEDYFGVAVSLTDDWLLVGAHREDFPRVDSGSVYAYFDDVIFKDGFDEATTEKSR